MYITGGAPNSEVEGGGGRGHRPLCRMAKKIAFLKDCAFVCIVFYFL
jgi:hypothetical protein